MQIPFALGSLGPCPSTPRARPGVRGPTWWAATPAQLLACGGGLQALLWWRDAGGPVSVPPPRGRGRSLGRECGTGGPPWWLPVRQPNCCLLWLQTDHVLWLPSLPTLWRQRTSNVSKFLLVRGGVSDSAISGGRKSCECQLLFTTCVVKRYSKNARVEHTTDKSKPTGPDDPRS